MFPVAHSRENATASVIVDMSFESCLNCMMYRVFFYRRGWFVTTGFRPRASRRRTKLNVRQGIAGGGQVLGGRRVFLIGDCVDTQFDNLAETQEMKIDGTE